ncbi:MAG: S8 family serine peptidase [Planctomycetes bacterium]|nr:S8 family serine peptidase [Planctomycetota bacterium]
MKDALRLPEAWLEAPARGAGVLVAIVDTGLDAACEALRGACEPAIDLTEPGGAAQDEHGHGTAMAAIIAGRREGEAARGFLGVAPGARVLPVKVADERGAAPLDRVARGILAAAERGARVIYVGLGVRGRSPALAAAVDHARRAGALVVAPAGNDSLDQVRSPAAEPGALAIGGLGAQDGAPDLALALSSNRGPEVALWAPAERVPAPYRGRACYHDGTSTAAALTAGVAALALGRAPDLDAAALVRCLQAGGAPLPQVERTVLAERIAARALDGLGATLRAARDHAEVQVAARLTPAVPQAGQPARLEVVVRNVGHAPLARVEVDVGPRGAGSFSGPLPPRQQVADLAPGEARTLTFAVTPGEGPGGALVEAAATQGARGRPERAAPCSGPRPRRLDRHPRAAGELRRGRRAPGRPGDRRRPAGPLRGGRREPRRRPGRGGALRVHRRRGRRRRGPGAGPGRAGHAAGRGPRGARGAGLAGAARGGGAGPGRPAPGR